MENQRNDSRKMFEEIDKYQEYAKKIHILGAELDRLKDENKTYD